MATDSKRQRGERKLTGIFMTVIVVGASITFGIFGISHMTTTRAAAPSALEWPVDVTKGTWTIISGYYNYDHGCWDVGRSDLNCPEAYQLYGLDLTRTDNPNATVPGTPVISPADGYITNHWGSSGPGECVIIAIDGYPTGTDGYSTRRISLCHVILNNSVGTGSQVFSGKTTIGSIADWQGNEHLHFSLYNLDPNSGDNPGARTPVPFTGTMHINGCQDFTPNGTLNWTAKMYNGQQNQESGNITCGDVPGGFWIGPTPSDGSVVAIGNVLHINVRGIDHSGSGLDHINITEWQNGGSWHILKTTSPFSVTTLQADLYYDFIMPNTLYVLVSFDVYSKNGRTNLAPNGIRQFCTASPCQPYSSSGGGGNGSGGGGSNGVVLCTDTGFQGTCRTFTEGIVSDLSPYGLSGNVSSIRVPSTYTLFLNDGINLSGQPEIFNQDVSDLTASGWNDRAKSLKIETIKDTSCSIDPNANGVVIYRDANFQIGGGCKFITSDVPDFGPSTFTGFSGLRFVGSYQYHYKVTIYVDANYGTACGDYWLDQSDLRNCAGVGVSLRIQPYTPPQQAQNIALLAARDHPSSDAAVDDNLSTEWIGGHGTPIGFVFASSQQIQDVVVFDRAQSSSDNNQINKLQLVFSDGTTINDIDMISGGPRCADVSFPAKTVSWVNIAPTDASGNNGYREIQIWDMSGSVYSQNNCVNKLALTPTPGSGPVPIIPPPNNTAPQVVNNTCTVQEGNSANIQIEAIDAEHDSLILSASNLPIFSSFTDNHDGTGTLNLNPTVGQAGTYSITIQANDGQLTGSGTATITVTPSPTFSPPPPPWSGADIGNPSLSGSQSLSNGTWTVQGAGADIWSAADQFHYVWQSLAGDGSMSAHVLSQTNTDAWAKGGVMFRQDNSAGSAFYLIALTPGNGIVVQYRTDQGVNAQINTKFSGSAPVYLRATRIGNTFTSATSADGITWASVTGSSVTLNVSGTILTGLAVDSNNVGVLNSVTFNSVSIKSACPSKWKCADIGNPNPSGGQSLSKGIWTIQGAGGDIWGKKDQFHYVWQPLAGDGSVSAHMLSQANTSDWAKGGIMFRQTNSANSAYYAVELTPGNGIVVQYRASKGTNAVNLVQINGTTPTYLKAVRTGSTITAYVSSDGITWTAITGSAVIVNWNGSLLAGLAVTSHAAPLCTVTFDSVKIG